MKTVEAKFRVVTPMFIGDAEQHAGAVRPPAIKGALRFWWRAMNWAAALRQKGNHEVAALEMLHEREAHLFGSAGDERSGGQGIFIVNVVEATDLYPLDSEYFIHQLTPGHKYLLGQGLYDRGNRESPEKIRRSALNTGTFAVRLVFRNGRHIDDIKSVVNALVLFGLLGGLGSRVRRGFGSVSIVSMSGNTTFDRLPTDAEGYGQAIGRLVGDRASLPSDLPPHTAFSQASRIDVSLQGTDAWSLLGQIGSKMQLYRSYGRRDREGVYKVGDQRALQLFRQDHDLVYRIATDPRSCKASAHPERVVFGLPHNYFFSQRGVNKVDVNGETSLRRASPLFIHMHQFPNGHCVAVQTMMPAQFLPKGEKIVMRVRGADVPAEQNIAWDHRLPEYLDGKWIQPKPWDGMRVWP